MKPYLQSTILPPSGLHISLPELREGLRDLVRGDLLDPEDDDAGDDDADDVEEGEGEADHAQHEGLQRLVVGVVVLVLAVLSVGRHHRPEHPDVDIQ